jgi:hypothetical protein
MKSKLIKNQLGVNFVQNWGYSRGLYISKSAWGDDMTTSLFHDVAHTYYKFFHTKDEKIFKDELEKKCESLDGLLNFEDAIYNMRISGNNQSNFLHILSEISGLDILQVKEKLPNKLNEVYQLLPQVSREVFSKIFHWDADIATLLMKSDFMDKIGTSLFNEWDGKENLKIWQPHFSNLLHLKNFEDFKTWQDSLIYHAKCRYLDATNSDCYSFISNIENRDLFIRTAFAVESCKAVSTRNLKTSIGAAQTDCYFLSVVNSKSEYGATIPTIASTAVFVADGPSGLAENLIQGAFLSVSNIIICLTYSTYDGSPNVEYGWWNRDDDIEVEVSIGDKNVFFVSFDDSNPNAVRKNFSERLDAIGMNLPKVGPIKFNRTNKFRIYETPEMHQALTDALIEHLVNFN